MNVTIVVPSLDPDEKLMLVVQGLLDKGFRDIVLVNDGSHADHLSPFEEAALHPEVTVLTHEVNKGKGVALKTAFTWILEHRKDCLGVVTADGDNQHRPEDILACAEAMAADPSKVWLGVRDFSLDHVPLRSRFGNTVTKTFMKLACGVGVTDTQTGLRAIAFEYLPLMCRIPGDRYEYETQMLLSLHDEKIGIGEVIIDTVYIDENQTSHFNTLRDSWKIYKIIFRHIFRSSFLKFSACSVLCFFLDYGLFTLLNSVILRDMATGSRELYATYGARIVSAVVNFTVNHHVVFKAGCSMRKSAVRYAALAVVQAAASALLVVLIHRATGSSQLMETVIKIPVDVFLFLLSYKIQKKWVFSEN